MLVEVDKAAGRPNQNIDAVAQGFGLILVTGASVNQAHAQGCVFAELGGVSMNLYRQFLHCLNVVQELLGLGLLQQL